jgi:hypothetical protein
MKKTPIILAILLILAACDQSEEPPKSLVPGTNVTVLMDFVMALEGDDYDLLVGYISSGNTSAVAGMIDKGDALKIKEGTTAVIISPSGTGHFKEGIDDFKVKITSGLHSGAQGFVPEIFME